MQNFYYYRQLHEIKNIFDQQFKDIKFYFKKNIKLHIKNIQPNNFENLSSHTLIRDFWRSRRSSQIPDYEMINSQNY